MLLRKIYIGYDTRQLDAFVVARESCRQVLNLPTPINSIVLKEEQKQGFYTRPISRDLNGRMIDTISKAPMSTEFALTRFLIPRKCQHGWVLFVDSDVLFRVDPNRMVSLYGDSSKAVIVVKHDHVPKNTSKMDNQQQTTYEKKNWSSVMLFNCAHPAHKKLTLDLINSERGLHLHQFCWLKDHEIGEMPDTWNWLVGHSSPQDNPGIVHFTDGVPSMPGHEKDPYADEWNRYLTRFLS